MPIIDIHHFRSLWERASSRAEASRHHLLLVVDGLDEDLTPEDSPTVARLLPAVAGGNTHVLVSSRPSFDLHREVELGHPYREIEAVALDAFEGAADQAEQAKEEIDDLKQRDAGLGTDVLGFLTAAAGPLSVADVATLTAYEEHSTASHERQIRRLITEKTARSLEAVGREPDVRYQFAHISLLEYAQSDQELQHPSYRERIYSWARDWIDRRAWVSPDSAPPLYLLDAYPATLAGRSRYYISDPESLASDPANAPRAPDRQQLTDLVTHIGWVDSAVAAIGVDPVLATLRTACSVAPKAERAADMEQLLELQSHHLRNSSAASTRGYTATMVGWEALLQQRDVVRAEESSALLRRLPGPQLIPLSTFDVASRKKRLLAGRHQGAVSAVAVTHDGRVITGGLDRAVRLWDLGSRDPLRRELGRHDGWVRTLAVTGNGLVVSGGQDGMVLMWDPRDAHDSGRLLGRHSIGAVETVAVTRDGLVVSGGQDGMVVLWDPCDESGRQLGHHHGTVRTVAVTGEGLVVSTAEDHVVHLWDPSWPNRPGRELVRQNGSLLLAAAPDVPLIVLTAFTLSVFELSVRARHPHS